MNAKEYNKAVDRWSDEVYRFALRLCGDVELGRDIVQEAFAGLWSQRERVDEAQGRGFLVSVAFRRSKDHWRKRYRTCPEADATDYRPEHHYDMKDALEQALAGLPEVQRAIVELRDVQGFSYKEIAEILSISEQQVGVYLYRARIALRQQLTDYGYHQ